MVQVGVQAGEIIAEREVARKSDIIHVEITSFLLDAARGGELAEKESQLAHKAETERPVAQVDAPTAPGVALRNATNAAPPYFWEVLIKKGSFLMRTF